MKKLSALVISFLLFFSLISGVSAQDESITASPAAETQATVSATAYKLPYPGILPDNPLYKLKTLRDKIILFLIRDPYKQAEKHQELADKELFAALKLAEKDNMPLAVHTAFKGEHHMTVLVDSIKNAIYAGGEWNQDIANKAYEATGVHKQLFQGMLDRAEGEHAESIRTIMEFSERNASELRKLEQEVNSPTQQMEKTEGQ